MSIEQVTGANDFVVNDKLIIEELKQRNKVAFDYIFTYFYSSLCAFSMQYVKDRAAVEDLVQDMFVALWQEAPNLNINKSLRAYLFTSIKNRSLDYLRRQRVIEKYNEYLYFSADRHNNNTELYYSESELHHCLQEGLKKLSKRCCEIFTLNRINGLSNNEISIKLGISKRTVELQISNALKVLREELADYLPPF